MAIPRLERPKRPERKEPDKPRVVKACDSCRKRKVKCSREHPQCNNCMNSQSMCTYSRGRKDRLKDTAVQNARFISFLQDLKSRVDDSERQRIQNLLEENGDDDAAPGTADTEPPTLGKRLRDDRGLYSSRAETLGESKVSGSVGSNEDIDLVDEDPLHNPKSRATGFQGKNSEVQWLRSLKANMERSISEKGSYRGPPGTSEESAQKRIAAKCARTKAFDPDKDIRVNDSSFYLDDENLQVGEFLVEPYHIPPTDTARALFNCYMDTIHSYFPIMPAQFGTNFEQYLELARSSRPASTIDKFQAILNLIFAIGAKYSHLTRAEWAADEGDHLHYVTRAIRLLGLNDGLNVIAKPDLGLIQATGLLSFYYLIIGHVSRAWVMIGISIRFALAVGLHLRHEDSSVAPERKELLIKTWWSLQCIEWLLSAITGRPCVISNKDCTVPLPQPYLKGERIQSLASLSLSYFRARIKIGLITQETLATLYSPRTAALSWKQTQGEIASLLERLEAWALSMSMASTSIATVTYESIHSMSLNRAARSIQREQLLLAMVYRSLKLQITRPCLCRIEDGIKEQSSTSEEFDKRIAAICIQTAEDMTKLFPDQPDAGYIYKQCPWWCIVHYIMQAVAVFLLEIANMGGYASPSKRTEIKLCVKKLLSWLRCLATENLVAERALKVVINTLKAAPRQLEAEFSDILANESAVFAPYRGDHLRWDFYDWNSDFQSRHNSSIHPNVPRSNQAQYFSSVASQDSMIGQGLVSGYDVNALGVSNMDSVYQWSSDLGFELPQPTYGSTFNTPFDQPNPLLSSM